MAKKRANASADGENTSAYFKGIFAKQPNLLHEKSNAELLSRWLADHPEHTSVPENIKNNLSNIKSVLRKKSRKRGRPKKTHHAEPAAASVVVVEMKPARAAVRSLETLEERIDDCLTMARGLNRDELIDVVRLLRRARNEVVWKMGEP